MSMWGPIENIKVVVTCRQLTGVGKSSVYESFQKEYIMRKVSYDPEKFQCKFENDGGITLTRINHNNEAGKYVLRYYGDYKFGEGSVIRAWRKN